VFFIISADVAAVLTVLPPMRSPLMPSMYTLHPSAPSSMIIMVTQLWQTSIRVAGLVVTAIIVALAFVHPTHAATFTCGDVACLIAAINTANTNGEDDTINLLAGTYTLTAVNTTISRMGLMAYHVLPATSPLSVRVLIPRSSNEMRVHLFFVCFS
jgi:hypothetical protein